MADKNFTLNVKVIVRWGRFVWYKPWTWTNSWRKHFITKAIYKWAAAQAKDIK